jgi:hypothetical protein
MMADVKLTGLDGVLDVLKKLPTEVVSKRGGPVRASLRKGAVVLHKQAVANLQAQLNNEAGDEAGSTNLLIKNVVVTRGKPPSEGNGERYLVRVRRKVYPGRTGPAVTTLKTAQIKEYGSVKQPAKPWLRPAFSKAPEAIRVVNEDLVKRINSIVRKLSRSKGSK